MALPPVGAQLLVFSGNYDINTQTDEILDCIAAAGYAGVEGGAKDAVAYKRALDTRGLKFGGQHVGLNSLSDLPTIVEYMRVVETTELSNSGLTTWNNPGLEDYVKSIEILNEAGRKLKDDGINLHYHNHAFEFEKVDGEKTGMDLLIAGLNPAYCDLCVDVAWVHKGGEDPAAFLKKHQNIVGYLHYKDYDDEGWCELGRGKVEYAPILEVVAQMPHISWAMIEQDTTRNEPKDSATESRRYLRDTFAY